VSKTQEKGAKIPIGLSGVAGEYLVAAELSRRGFIASLTIRNAKGIDILASNLDATKSVGIQVKTNQNGKKYWLMNVKAERILGTNLFYVFVSLHGENALPRYHVVPSSTVAEYISKSHKNWLTTPGVRGQTRQDTKMRKFEDYEDKFLDRWDLLELA
jgi:hypothetical protein